MYIVLILKLILYLFLLLFQRIKNIRFKFQILKFFISNYSLKNLFKFFQDRNINPSKNLFFKKFTSLNQNKWKKTNFYNTNNKDDIFLTSFVHLPEDVIPNSIIAKYLANIKKSKIIAIIDKEDIQAEIIMRSYGIKNFRYLKNPSIISEIIFFIKSFFLLEKIKTFKNFFNYKKNKIHFGKIVIEHVIRHTGKPYIEKLDFKVCYFLAQAFLLEKKIEKIFKEFSSRSMVMSENQFLPSGVIFQKALTNKISVFGRSGAPKKISVVKFSNVNEIYTERAQVSEKFYSLITKKNINFISEKGKKLFYKRVNKMGDPSFKRENFFSFNKSIKNYSKKDICKLYGWDESKKILGIYAHTFLDGNYVLGWRTFNDNFDWLDSTLKVASDLKKFNFLAKPHPMDKFYKRAKFNTSNLIGNYIERYNNIKLFPDDISIKSGLKVIDVGITSHGTVSLECMSYGKPCITAGRTSWGDMILNEKPISKKKYFYSLVNAEKLLKPKKDVIKKLHSYIYIQQNLMAIEHPLLADILVNRDVNRIQYWRESLKLLKKYNFKNDIFRSSFEYQIKNNFRHTINLKKLEQLKIYEKLI